MSKSYYKPVSTDSKAEVILTLGSHFHDLTPLNYTPESDIIAESVPCCTPTSLKSEVDIYQLGLSLGK